MAAYESALNKFAQHVHMNGLIQEVDPNCRPRTKREAVETIKEMVANGSLPAERLARFLFKHIASGDKHVYLYGIEEKEAVQGVARNMADEWQPDLLLNCDKPDQATLLARYRSEVGEHVQVTSLYLQTCNVVKANYADTDFVSEQINYYVLVVFDTAIPWLAIAVEPTENLRLPGTNPGRAPWVRIAEQYRARFAQETGLHMSPLGWAHAEVMKVLRHEAMQIEHPQMVDHMALLEGLSREFAEQCAAGVGMGLEYAEQVLPNIMAGWKGALVQWYQQDANWSPEAPGAPGHVQRQRSRQRDGTVLDTRSLGGPLHKTMTHYSTEHVVDKAQSVEKLDFVWLLPDGRHVRTLFESGDAKALVSFPSSTTEEDMRYVLSRIGEYHRRVTNNA